jgi:FkbM family methyltransferase
MIKLSKVALSTIAMLLVLVAVALSSGFVGVRLGREYERNGLCCQIPRSYRKIVVSAKEMLGLATFHSEFGQDKWVLEAVFPGVKNGFFLDVGSADGTIGSNTKALERKGRTGICIDPFPRNMEDRTCQMFKEVVFSQPGKLVKFRAAGNQGGVEDTLGAGLQSLSPEDLARAEKAPDVEFTTVTLGDILERAKAPSFIHFVSLDIEGAELHALRGFPFDKYRIGALDVEHNYEEPKRSEIEALMKSHGYKRVHSWYQDDFYVNCTIVPFPPCAQKNP